MDERRSTGESRRIVLDGAAVEARRDGDLLVAADGRRIGVHEAVHLPPVEPTKIICVHLNYRSRAEELRTAPPPAPHYFQKPLSCLNGHKGTVVRPRGCRFLNYEGEIAIVIGRAARNIRIAEAPGHIAGYTLANDFALHDFRDADRGAMLRVKGADTLGVVGPGLVRGWEPADQVLRTRVNGKVVQESSVAGMIFSMAYLVADLARTMTLLPGDLILSGTPANSRPVEPGDLVTVEADGLGVLESRIIEGESGISDECGWPPSASDKVLGVALGQALRE